MIGLSIQIVNYKTKKYLADCLESLLSDLQGISFKWEVNILDNDSGDDLKYLEKQYSKVPIHFFYSDKNLGFGGGHNFLAKKSQAKYLLILNPDIKFIEANTVHRLLAILENDPVIKIAGPELINSKNHVQLWDHGELEGFLAKVSFNAYWKTHKRICEVAWVSGAVFLMEKTAFDELQGFDEKIFLYGEEVELCFRARKLGYQIFYDPTIKVFHQGGVAGKRGEYVRQSNDYFLDKHYHNHPFYWVFKAFNKIIPVF